MGRAKQNRYIYVIFFCYNWFILSTRIEYRRVRRETLVVKFSFTCNFFCFFVVVIYRIAKFLYACVRFICVARLTS